MNHQEAVDYAVRTGQLIPLEELEDLRPLLDPEAPRE